MARTYAQLRELTAKQTRLFYLTGTVNSSGSSGSILRDDALRIYSDNQLNGFHVLITSGSPSDTELHIKDFFHTDGDALFEPPLSAAPDSLTYEVLPFSGTDFLHAIQDAILEAYDHGWLQRNHWSRIVGGSPIYNADFSYWTSSTAVDGWTVTDATVARERASANLGISETSVALTTAVGHLDLDATWQRYLQDYREQSLTLYCLVKTTAGSNARLNFYTGTNNYSTYHSGTNRWELLNVEVTTDNSDTAIQPRFYIDTTTTAYFNMPYILNTSQSNSGVTREYPFTINTMPDGPSLVSTTYLDIRKSELDSGRGLGTIRQLPRQNTVLSPRVVKHHDENATGEVGILDFSQSRRPPRDGELLWLRGGGPLTVPTSALSTDNIEVNETESLLLAKMAAVHLLQGGKTGSASSVGRLYSTRITELEQEISMLAMGAGQSRDVATYGLGW